MSDFSKYFLMINEEDPVGTEKVVIEYTFLKTQGTGKGKIDWDRDSMKAKIPAEHGNLNHVCRVTDSKGHSIYIRRLLWIETARSQRFSGWRSRWRLGWFRIFIFLIRLCAHPEWKTAAISRL